MGVEEGHQMEEALQVEEAGQGSQVKEVEEAEEGGQEPQMLRQRLETQKGMRQKTLPVQHGQMTDPQVQLQTGWEEGQCNPGHK